MSEETTGSNCGTAEKPSCGCPLRDPENFIEKSGAAILDAAKRLVTAGRIDLVARFLERVGYGAVLVGSVMLLITAIRLFGRGGSWFQLRTALISVVLAPLFLFLTVKFIRLGRDLIASSPTRLRTPVIMDGLAFLCLVTAPVILISDIVLGCKGASENLIIGVVEFVFLIFIASLALAPQTLNIVADEQAGLGETALGIVMFIGKVLLKAVPVIFGLLAVIVVFVLIAAQIDLGRGNDLRALNEAVMSGHAMILAVLLPLAGMLSFLLLSLICDVLGGLARRRDS